MSILPLPRLIKLALTRTYNSTKANLFSKFNNNKNKSLVYKYISCSLIIQLRPLRPTETLALSLPQIHTERFIIKSIQGFCLACMAHNTLLLAFDFFIMNSLVFSNNVHQPFNFQPPPQLAIYLIINSSIIIILMVYIPSQHICSLGFMIIIELVCTLLI